MNRRVIRNVLAACLLLSLTVACGKSDDTSPAQTPLAISGVWASDCLPGESFLGVSTGSQRQRFDFDRQWQLREYYSDSFCGTPLVSVELHGSYTRLELKNGQGITKFECGNATLTPHQSAILPVLQHLAEGLPSYPDAKQFPVRANAPVSVTLQTTSATATFALATSYWLRVRAEGSDLKTNHNSLTPASASNEGPIGEPTILLKQVR